MNLDDLTFMKSLDPENMLAQIDALPNQLATAWEEGGKQPLPQLPPVEQVVIAGMGGSAIGADLLAAYVEPVCTVPIHVLRDYSLPAWASGAGTLFIGSSHSGNTEETLSAFEQAAAQGCSLLAITTGGKLAQAARDKEAAIWIFEHKGQPRAAAGFSFGYLLAAFARLKLIPDPQEEVARAVAAMRQYQVQLQPATPAVQNPAKRQALQLIDRWVTIFGAEHLAPVARRWKTQINELGKAWAQFEFLPEGNHNTLAGLLFPGALNGKAISIFLSGEANHPRNLLRLDLTRQVFMLEGITTDYFHFEENNRLPEQWRALLLGDYVAYYLAMAYEIDPTPVEMLEGFKAEMAQRG